MALEFTKDGLSIETFLEIYDRISEGYKSIYGQDINLEQDTPDGQRIGITAKEIQDIQSYCQLLYSQLDVDFSFGAFFDVILKLTGITRQPATQSVASIRFTCDRDLTIPEGYIIEDDNGKQWATDESHVFTAGISNFANVYAQEFGSIEALANTITNPITIVLGVTEVTNTQDAIPGRDEETEEEVRARRRKSLELPSYSTLGSTIARTGEIEGVTDVVGYENKTDTTDANGIPPHSFWIIVEGDLTDDIKDQIAEVFVRNKTAGAGYKGAVSASYVETIPRPNGAEFIITHDVLFDQPEEVDLYVRINATPASVDKDLVKSKIAEKIYIIGENAYASALYAFAYNSGPDIYFSDLEISLDDITYTDGEIAADPDQKFLLDVSIITVN